MPCRDDYPVGSCEDPGLRQSADQATRAACDMRTILRRHNLEHELCTETRKWIAKHDEADRIRIEAENAAGIREATKRRGLAKLSIDERRALGL
jgi:hypothetical protein